MHIEAREALLWIKTKCFSEVCEWPGLCQCAPRERLASAHEIRLQNPLVPPMMALPSGDTGTEFGGAFLHGGRHRSFCDAKQQADQESHSTVVE